MDIQSWDLGRRYVPYIEAWEKQRELHAAVANQAVPDTLVLVEHESVFTAGKRTSKREWPLDGTPVVEVDRGGRITWHGPGQLVVYPILRLSEPIDVIKYVRALESGISSALAEFGLDTVSVEGRSGVWLPATETARERKICAIGVRVSQGVTMHGIALNCNPDMGRYQVIVPCGIDDADVTSMSLELNRDVTISEVQDTVVEHLTLALRDLRSNSQAKEFV